MASQSTSETFARARALRDALDRALAQRDRAGAVSAALSAVAEETIGIADLYTLVLAPLMVDTGSAWQSGDLAVWEEHFATATVRTIVEALYPSVAKQAALAPRRDPRVILACPPGEQHDLALRMLTDRFALAGFEAYFLGADTPVTEIVDAVRTLDARLLVLSAATHYNRAALRATVAEIARQLPGVRIGVGGPAFLRDCEGFADQLLDPAELGLPGAPLPPSRAEDEG
jgi:methanogenic corrinoid protein MtbC1